MLKTCAWINGGGVTCRGFRMGQQHKLYKLWAVDRLVAAYTQPHYKLRDAEWFKARGWIYDIYDIYHCNRVNL